MRTYKTVIKYQKSCLKHGVWIKGYWEALVEKNDALFFNFSAWGDTPEEAIKNLSDVLKKSNMPGLLSVSFVEMTEEDKLDFEANK